MPETLSALEVELSPVGIEQVKLALVDVQKEQKKTEKGAHLMGAAQIAAIYGIIKSSPIAQSYLQELSAITGVFADTILTSLMPVIEPLMGILWAGSEAFEALNPNIQYVIASIIAMGIAMKMLWTTNPWFAGITALILLLVLLQAKFHWVEAAASGFGAIIGFITDKVRDLCHWLTGASLVPDLKLLGDIIKTAVAPQLMIMKAGVEGITRVVEVGGSVIQKTFNMFNTFTFGGIIGGLEAVKEGFEAVGSAANKVKGWLSI